MSRKIFRKPLIKKHNHRRIHIFNKPLAIPPYSPLWKRGGSGVFSSPLWKRGGRGDFIVLLAVLLVGLILRLLFLGNKPLWLDEMQEFLVSHGGLRDILRFCSLGSVFEHVITGAVLGYGDGETILRLPSAIWGTLTIPAAYFMAKRILDKEIALFGSLFLCLSFFHIYYSQEMRPHSLTLFLFILSLAVLIQAKRYRRSIYRISYLFLMTLLSWTSLLAPVIWLSHIGIFLLFPKPQGHTLSRSDIFFFLLAPLLIILSIYIEHSLSAISVLWVRDTLFPVRFRLGSLSHLSGSLHDLIHFFSGGGGARPFILAGLSLLGIPAAVSISRRGALALLSTIFLYTISIIFFLKISGTFYAARYLLPLLPLALILMACGLHHPIRWTMTKVKVLRDYPRIPVSLAIGLILSLYLNIPPLVSYYKSPTKYSHPQDWYSLRETAKSIQSPTFVYLDPGNISPDHFIGLFSGYILPYIKRDVTIIIPDREFLDVYPPRLMGVKDISVVSGEGFDFTRDQKVDVWWVCFFPHFETWGENNLLSWWRIPAGYDLDQRILKYMLGDNLSNHYNFRGISLLQYHGEAETVPDIHKNIRRSLSFLVDTPRLIRGRKPEVTSQMESEVSPSMLNRGLESLLTDSPHEGSGEWHYWLGVLFAGLKMSDSAQSHLEKSLSLESCHRLSALLYLSQIYKDKGHIDKALELIRQALAEEPDSIWANIAAASIYKDLGQFGESRKFLEKVKQINPAFEFDSLRFNE